MPTHFQLRAAGVREKPISAATNKSEKKKGPCSKTVALQTCAPKFTP